MRRSSSAITHRCAASRSPSAAIRPCAVSSPRRATRRARSACARRSRCRARSASARRSSSSAPTFTSTASISQQIFEIYREVTPLVEPLSLDEAYLDVTENAWNEPLGVNVARRLKERIKEATSLTASAGVAPNKFLAKIASGWKKPDGLTVVAPERVEKFLQGLPVDALWGVGPVTAARLREHGIEKLVDVRARTVDELDRDRRHARRVADRPRARARRSRRRAESAVEVGGLGRDLRHRSSNRSKK